MLSLKAAVLSFSASTAIYAGKKHKQKNYLCFLVVQTFFNLEFIEVHEGFGS